MNTLTTDTLGYDVELVNVWQADPAYNYNRELLTPDVNILEWIGSQMAKLWQELLGNEIVSEYGETIVLVFTVLFVLFLVWFIYKKRPSLFVRLHAQAKSSGMVEDTIYGVDFEQSISQAMLSGDYKEAVRLLYLQTLKSLDDDGRIVWQPYKTPTQYKYEVHMEAFNRLTNDFLRVRYGNFEATEILFGSMRALQDEVKKGGGV